MAATWQPHAYHMAKTWHLACRSRTTVRYILDGWVSGGPPATI